MAVNMKGVAVHVGGGKGLKRAVQAGGNGAPPSPPAGIGKPKKWTGEEEGSKRKNRMEEAGDKIHLIPGR